MEKHRKELLVSLGKWLIAVVPIAWIFSTVDFNDFLQALIALPAWVTLVVITIVISSLFLQGFRWWLLLRAGIDRVSLPIIMAAHWKAVFYSLVVPSSAAQDVIRAAIVAKSSDYRVVWGSSWLNKLLGLFAFLMLTCIGLLLLNPGDIPLPREAQHAMLIGMIVVPLALAFSFSKALTRRFRPLLNRVLPRSLSHFLEEIREAVYVYRHKRKSIAVAFIPALLLMSLIVFNHIVILYGITGTLYIRECIFFIPLIEMSVIFLPITPNGAGIRELMEVFFVTHYLGLQPAAMGVYVVMGFWGHFLRLLGGCVVLKERLFPSRERSIAENGNMH